MALVLDIKSSRKYRQTVLLVDDQPMVLEIHAAMLKSAMPNLRIVSMTDPLKALDWLMSHSIDLIITDYKMKQMNGVSFVTSAKRLSNGAMPPIIVVTALKDANVHQALLLAGVSICLTKPTSAVQLVEISRRLLNITTEYFAA
jgi:two-component system, chemotaxis family, chemotaxis protein CheY